MLIEKFKPMDAFLGKTLLVFTAHPDDETFGMGGTIYKNQQKGGRTFVVSATLGEKGSSHLAKPVGEETLKAIRKKEILAAGRFLKVSRVHLLNLPDGKLHTMVPRMYREGLEIAREVKPDAILSFGRFGMSGHRDHIAAGQAAARIAAKLHIPIFTLTLPPKLVPNFVARIKQRRRNPHYTRAKPFFEKPAVKISIDPAVKLKAARFHKSQLGGREPFAAFPPSIRRLRLRAEYFARQK